VILKGQLLDQKSWRAVTGKTADWNEIAKDCIAIANATGGRLLPGIEDGQDAPLAGQHIPADLPDTLRRKLAERTVSVAVLPDVVIAPNRGQYIELRIPRAEVDATKRDKLLAALRASDRVNASVKEKSDDELFDRDQLIQRERIALGLLEQHDAMTARELSAVMNRLSVAGDSDWAIESGHLTAYSDLASNGVYPPSLRKSHASNPAESRLNRYRSCLFSLIHASCLS